jgi:hypothetical protein
MMNEKAFEKVERDLNLATGEVKITEGMINLDRFRITSESEIQPKEYTMEFLGRPCFPRKDLSVFAGVAKTGKTFVTSMLMAAATTSEDEPSVLALKRIRKEPLKVMWYDTEQSLETTKEIMVKRIAKMVGGTFPDTQFFVFNVRAMTAEERKKMLGVAIESYRPDIVIVDGIADLLADINDGPKAIELISELLRLADKNNCNITVNIHLNRSGEKSNLRGWLGSMLLQKAFEVFNCAKVFKTDVLSVELFMSRKVNESVIFYYKINSQGLPESTGEPDTQQRDENGRFVSQETQKGRSGLKFNSDYQRDDSDSDKGWSWDLRRLFSDAMQNSAMMGYDDLKTRVMKLGNIIRSSYYETVFAMAEEQGFVKKTQDRNLRVVVVMPPAG